jgi:thiosulfate/3-mercaptopyruvate sulfurtransferase
MKNAAFAMERQIATWVLTFLAGGLLMLGNPAAVFARHEERPSSPSMLAQPAALQSKLGDKGLRVLDARPQADYIKGHIPGAVWVNVKGWQKLGGKEGGLHDADAWAVEIGKLGIGPDTSVVVYGSSLPDTARVWWTLKYLGLANVAILDGGWQLWTKERRPVDSGISTVQLTEFEPKFQPDRLEEIDTLKKSMQSGQVTVVDARSAGEFTGKEVRGKRGGHIPGAKLLEWKELLTEDGRFKPPEQLRELFRQRGVEPGKTAVAC